MNQPSAREAISLAPVEPATEPLRILEGRFARLEAIEWWDQELLARSRVLVVGAGALGNEVIKNLALLGIGYIGIIDMDRIELSNLCRSILFRESDQGQFKAERAASAAKAIFDRLQARAIVGNVLADVGLGWFRWADVVIGALDNREARVFVNSACARVGRPWIDGGIEVLTGVARGFAPPRTACYECTMSQVDWDLLNKRRSCSLLARRALAQRGTPTTPTTASVIGAIQAQETIKLLHGMGALLGGGFVFEGGHHSSYTVQYPIAPECPWHETPATIESMPHFHRGTKMSEVWQEGVRRLGGLDALEFSREVVGEVSCQTCGNRAEIFQAAEKVSEEQLRCPSCGAERAPAFLHGLTAGSPWLERSAQEIGLPPWDILWARRGSEVVGFEFSGDSAGRQP
jgi:molybdopterin/thiamine biosynthesis adenylyltransferase